MTDQNPPYPASPARVACRHFPECGGCQTLGQTYASQLADKQSLLQERLRGFAGLEIQAISPSPATAGYRFKVQLPFGQSHGKVTLGCYAKDSHVVVNQEVCVVQDRELTACAFALRQWAQDHGMSVYDEKAHSGLLRHVLLRKGLGTGEILAGLIINAEPGQALPHAEDAVVRMQAALGEHAGSLRGLALSHNTTPTNAVLGAVESVAWGQGHIREYLDGMHFQLSLASFFQVNPYQAPTLFETAMKRLKPGMRVLDMYCGIGAFTLWAARLTGWAEGWESNAASVKAAQEAARINGMEDRSRFVAGEIGALLANNTDQLLDFQAIILDPPRKGLDREVTDALLEKGSDLLIYVSCNPNSLARDLLRLSAKYSADSLQPVDMMPHTRHTESVITLTRRKN